MLTISIASRFEIPKACGDRSTPRKEGDHYIFDATDEEYMFWSSLAPIEQEEIANSTFERCFFDVLHELMRKKRPNNYTIANEEWVKLKP